MRHELGKTDTGGSSRTNRVFRLFSHRKGSGARVSVRHGGGGGQGTRAGNGGHHRAVEGRGLALKDMRGDRARGRTEIRSHTPVESEEEIMTYNGIMRTTDFSVSRDDRSSGATEASWYGRLSRDRGPG